MIKAVCAENLYKSLFSRSETDHFITGWCSFPSTPRESSRLEMWSRRGAVAGRMGSALAAGHGQVLPGSARSRQRPELAAISARCWRPGGASAALPQPRRVFALPFNLSTPDAARELTGSSHEHPWSAGGSPILPPHSGQRSSARRAATALGRGKSQSKKVLYLPPQQRLCLWPGWSQNGLQVPRESN